MCVYARIAHQRVVLRGHGMWAMVSWSPSSDIGETMYKVTSGLSQIRLLSDRWQGGRVGEIGMAHTVRLAT